MRVAALHLGLEVGGGLVRGELAELLGQHQLPGEVEQEIADLAADLGRVAFADGMIELVDFFEEIGPERLAGLHPIPGAPVPEIAHHPHGASKR